VNDEGFSWSDLQSRPEPRLPADFASRVIEKARAVRARKRRMRTALSATAGLVAMLAVVLAIRSSQPTLTSDPVGRPSLPATFVAPNPTTSDFNTGAWSDEPDNDLLALLMPSAQPVRKFDAYYGTGSLDTYASWDPDSYAPSRTY
jgi:hypothetical protein